MKSTLITIIFLLNSSLCIGSSLGYYDLNLNETFLINIKKPSISAFHYIDAIKVCDKSDENICFNTEYFSFSMPKKLYYSTEWKIGKTKYCLIQRLHEKKSKSDTLIVSFGYDGTCEEIKEQDNKLVFNSKFGLRYMEGINTNGFPIKVISVDEYGFGAKNLVKTRR